MSGPGRRVLFQPPRCLAPCWGQSRAPWGVPPWAAAGDLMASRRMLRFGRCRRELRDWPRPSRRRRGVTLTNSRRSFAEGPGKKPPGPSRIPQISRNAGPRGQKAGRVGGPGRAFVGRPRFREARARPSRAEAFFPPGAPVRRSARKARAGLGRTGSFPARGQFQEPRADRACPDYAAGGKSEIKLPTL